MVELKSGKFNLKASAANLSPVSVPIATIPGSHVDQNGDHQDDNIECGPLAAIFVDHHTIPKRGNRHKEKAQHRPEDGAKYAGKPVSEKPQHHHKQSGKK